MGLHAPERAQAKSRQVSLQASNIMGTNRKIVNEIARTLVHRRSGRGESFLMVRFQFKCGSPQLFNTARCTSCQSSARCHSTLQDFLFLHIYELLGKIMPAGT